MEEDELVEAIFQRDLKIKNLKKENKKLKEFFTENIGNDILLSYDSDIGLYCDTFSKYCEIYYLVNNKKLLEE